MQYFTKRLSQVAIIILTLSATLLNVSAQQTNDIPLAEVGPYDVGLMSLNFTDSSRNDQINNVVIWYPATSNNNLTGEMLITEMELLPGPATLITMTSVIKAEPSRRSGNLGDVDAGSIVNVLSVEDDWAQIESSDITGWVKTDDYVNIPDVDASAAPYPLILYSHGAYDTVWHSEGLLQHLASYGFVVVAVNHNCDSESTCIIKRPFDMLFVLDQLANMSDSYLQGMIDTNNVGVAGYAMGGYTALSLAGARLDGEFFLNNHDGYSGVYFGFDSSSIETLDTAWSEITDYVVANDVTDDNGLYPAVADERIQSVLAFTPWLNASYGSDGLGRVNKPTLVALSTYFPHVYTEDVMPLYTGWANENRNIITAQGHAIGDFFNQPPNILDDFKHLSTAWFGYHLQGREDYQVYLSEDTINSLPNMVWGLDQAE